MIRLAPVSTIVVALLIIAVAGCGSASHTSTEATKSTPSVASSTTSPSLPLRSVRCGGAVKLPGHGDFSGPATVFIVGEQPRKRGCPLVSGWVASWVRAGAIPAGYATGRYVGFRCQAELTDAPDGPLGPAYSRYQHVIHCAQVDESSALLAPAQQLSATRGGIWAYIGAPLLYGSASNPKTGKNAIPGNKLNAAVSKQLTTFARVKPDVVTCPSLGGNRGATLICTFSGEALDLGAAKVRGTARVTIQDQVGHKAIATFQYTGPAGRTNGTGYPFDPQTGKTL
jgi:hypothetical protein